MDIAFICQGLLGYPDDLRITYRSAEIFSSWKIDRALIASWSWIEILSTGEGAKNERTICIYYNEEKRYLIHHWLVYNQNHALILDEWFTKHYGNPKIARSERQEGELNRADCGGKGM